MLWNISQKGDQNTRSKSATCNFCASRLFRLADFWILFLEVTLNPVLDINFVVEFLIFIVIKFFFRASIMVLDYIITVWDAAEPKTYNSKVS